MMRVIRRATAVLISLLPTNSLRVLAYKYVLGYQISGSYIGFGTQIAVKQAYISGARIGRNNRFIGPMHLTIHSGAKIGNANEFSCGEWTSDQQYVQANYTQALELMENSLITSQHFIDIAGSLVLGKNSWIAGRGSQFWTHGAGVEDRDISIGENCYIGSAVRFAPGSAIANNTLVAMGSVVGKKFMQDNALIGGVPAALIRENYFWKDRSKTAAKTPESKV